MFGRPYVSILTRLARGQNWSQGNAGGIAIRSARSERFCVVTREITENHYLKYGCRSQDHIHIGWGELNDLWQEGSLEPADKKPGFVGGQLERKRIGEGVEPDYFFEWLIPGKVIRYKRNPATRGLSAKYGHYLASKLNKGELWAQTMIANIRCQRETEELAVA